MPDERSQRPEPTGLYSRLQATRSARRLALLRTFLLFAPVLIVAAGLLVGRSGLFPSSRPVVPSPTPTAARVVSSLEPSRQATSGPAALSTPGEALRLSRVPGPGSANSPVPATPSPQAANANAQLPLYGRRIGLDPGHGPRGDMGATLVDPSSGRLILSEADLVLDVALRCRDILTARGASVMLTRETADTFTAPWPVDANGDGLVGAPGDDLQERVDILNNFHAEVFISVHSNAGTMDASHPDLQAIYCGSPDCPFRAQSAYLGQLVLNQLATRLAGVGYQVGGSQLETDLEADTSEPPQHLFILGPINPPRHMRATTMPGVLAESLFVSSPREAAELNNNDVRQAIALAYADALQAFLAGGDK